MEVNINIFYKGKNGSARKFVEEMVSSGVVDQIRAEAGNLRYEYFFPMEDGETVLLIDSWENQEALDFHHQSPMMTKIMELREKYDVRMEVKRYVACESGIPERDGFFIRE